MVLIFSSLDQTVRVSILIMDRKLDKISNLWLIYVGGKAAKELAATETKIKEDIYSAVKAKDAAKLKASYTEFIKVADLTSEYKDGELGQTDSSGYSPNWGTSKQYIYQR